VVDTHFDQNTTQVVIEIELIPNLILRGDYNECDAKLQTIPEVPRKLKYLTFILLFLTFQPFPSALPTLRPFWDTRRLNPVHDICSS
jgi:hypothetical protein